MGFRNDSYATLWGIEDKGNYSTAQITVSKKNKATGQYDIEFQDGFVRFVGEAHEKAKTIDFTNKKNVFIKITSCDVSNYYTKPDGTVLRTPRYTVFAFDFYDNVNGGGGAKKPRGKAQTQDTSFMNIPDGVDDEELPFN